MPLTTQRTASGRRKQAADELQGWKAIVNNAHGTPSQAQVDAVVTTWAPPPNGQGAAPPDRTPLAIDTSHANYGDWLEAHKGATRRARSDRQRRQKDQRKVKFHRIFLSCIPRHTWDKPRDTLRMAILHVKTLEKGGGGTQLKPNDDTKATKEELLDHLDKVLGAIEEELRNVSRHSEEHYLRASGHPPVQVLLASEWYFRKPNAPYTQAERNTIVTQLKILSRKYPEWLIVPGTIFWSPDDQAGDTIRVYNEAVALSCGVVLKRRIKREQHDMDDNLRVRAQQRWGPDYHLVAPPAYADPATIPPDASDLCAFSVRGHEFCVEICRDQWVGDAVQGYRNNAPGNTTGAKVFLFTSNNTQLTKGFIPARNDGYVAWSDGSGQNPQFYRINRKTRIPPINPTTLDQNPDPGNPDPFTAYRASFVPERDYHATFEATRDESHRIEYLDDADYHNFMVRFNAVFDDDPSSDLLLKTQVDHAIALGLAPRPIRDEENRSYEKGLRIEQLLNGGNLPGNQQIRDGESDIMTDYKTALVARGVALVNRNVTAGVTPGLRDTAERKFSVWQSASPKAIAKKGEAGDIPKLIVYKLVDLPP